MPLPATWSLVEIHGRYLRLDGSPNVGSVWFDSNSAVFATGDDGAPVLVVPRRIEVDLDDTGAFSVMLPVTDDPSINPVGWTYQVREQMPGGRAEFSIDVPSSETTIDLITWAQATPIPPVPPTQSYLTTLDIGVNVASQTDMQTAKDLSIQAASDAATAVTTAGTALTTAQGALATANGIADTANTALANSLDAQADAADAVATANGIDAKAQSALDASAAATTTANSALAQANNANTTANGIAATANTALTNSNTAITTANAASATANGIAATANTALTNANTAVTTANAATATANAAQTTANAALPATSNAVSASKLAAAVSFALTGLVTGSVNSDLHAGVSIATDIADTTLTIAKTNGLQAALNTLTTAAATAEADAQKALTWQTLNITFRNKLINPKFDFWQRGTTFTANAVYTADRWQIVAVGNSHIISQQAVAPQAAIPQKYVMKCSVTSVANANNTTLLQQPIEGVQTFANKRVCVTVEAWSSVAGKKIGVSCDQSFGTGGSPSAIVTGTGKSITLGLGLTKTTVFLDIPDITGKTLGTNNNDFLDLVIWLDAGSSFNPRSGSIGQLSADVYLKRLQIEEVDGANTGQPSAMEDRPAAIELMMCRRYYRKNFKMADAPVNNYAGFLIKVGACWGTPNVVVREDFGVPMRAVPTITFYSSSATGTGTGQWQFYVAGFVNAAVTLGAATEDGFSVNAAPAGTPTNAAVYCLGGYTAESEL